MLPADPADPADPAAPAAPERRDLVRLRRMPALRVLDSEEDFATHLKLGGTGRGGALRFTFGPRWRRSLRRIEVREESMLATLTLPEEFRGDLDTMGLHPALLDLAGAAARILAPDVYYMPFLYGRLEYHAPMTPTVLCAITVTSAAATETMTCDVEVLDTDGRLLSAITGLTIKRVADVDAVLAQVREPAPAGGAATGAGAAGGAGGLLESGIDVAEACRALDAVLAARWLPARLAVARSSVEAMRAAARTLTPATVADELARRTTTQETHPRPDLGTPYVAPRTDLERAVAAVWQEVLGVQPVGAQDDYFALGGHSLAAVQIGARLRQELGVDLDLRSFFDSPTVEGTAELLGRTAPAAGGARDDAIPVLPRDRGSRGDLADLGDRGGPGDRAVPAGDDGQDDVDTLLDALSDEEVEQRLRALLTEDEADPGLTAQGRDS